MLVPSLLLNRGKLGFALHAYLAALVTFIEELRAAELYYDAGKYARHGRALAHKAFTPGQIGYTMFDKYLQ